MEGVLYTDGEKTKESDERFNQKWYDISGELSAEEDMELESKLLERRSNGMSEKSFGRLEDFLRQYRSIFCVRYSGGLFAGAALLLMTTKPNAYSVWAKLRFNTPEKTSILQSHVGH